MNLSATLCRAQEELQIRRAEEAKLDNVREVALSAAAAWGEEAEMAEKREARMARVQAEARAIAEEKAAERQALDGGDGSADSSERSLADA